MATKIKKTSKAHHLVEERLIALRNLKETYGLQTKASEWREKANMKEVTSVGAEDYRTQISSVVKMQKDADLASALPEYEFIPENEDGRKNRKVVRETFNYWWIKSGTDKQVSKVAQSSTTYGTGILFEGIKHFYKTINVPFYNKGGELEFKEVRKLIYSGIFCRKIPFQNFFINGDDIDNSTEAIVIDYIDMDGYIAEKKDDPLYKNISKIKKTTKDHTYDSNTAGEDATTDQDDDNTVTEITYYNSAKDMYIILANGVEILNTHIPYEHKELPFCLFVDNMAEDRIYGIGEYELLEQDERTKNELRTLLITGVKASIGFILKDKEATFDEDDIFNGVGQLYETSDIEGIKQFSQVIPINALTQAEQKVDGDIIIKSGMDINSLQTSPETATKTAGKSVSSKKRINKNIKDNAYDFYTRLAYLRLKNIQFLHTIKVREIPIKGGSIQNDGIFKKDEANSFGSAKIGENLIKGEFLVQPIVESMIGNNRLRRKENALEYAQVGGSIVGKDGTPVIKGEALAELLTEEFGYDYDTMTQEASSSKSGADIINELDNTGNGISNDNNNPASPNFIPPHQRSGAAKPVSTISGQAKITPEELLTE